MSNTINIEVRRRLAEARTAVRPLAKTETATTRRQGYAADAESWTYAPAHVIHEEAQAALRLVGLEFDCRQWRVIEDGKVLEAVLQLVVVDKDHNGLDYEEWTAQMPITRTGAVGESAAAASALGWLKRHQRLDLLDLPCVPLEEERRSRERAADATWDRRREAFAAPPRRRLDDELPGWAETNHEADVVTAELARASAVNAFMDRRPPGCPNPMDLAYEVSGQTGKVKEPDLVTAAQWLEVERRILDWKEGA